MTHRTLLAALTLCVLTITLMANDALHRLRIYWQHELDPAMFYSQSIGEHAAFSLFDQEFCTQHNLPLEAIPYRSQPQFFVTGADLSSLITKLVLELHNGQTSFSHFTTLHLQDYSQQNGFGIGVFLCKHHPFVIKLFMTTPQKFVWACAQNLMRIFFYLSPPRTQRFLVGLTRIKNLHHIAKMINFSPSWSTQVTLPRKWFFVPPETRWITLESFNTTTGSSKKISFPGTFCIVEDYIQAARPLSHSTPSDCLVVKNLCRFIGPTLDPNLANFLWEKATNKLALIDTEDFRYVDKPLTNIGANQHINWIVHSSFSKKAGRISSSLLF